MQPGIDSRQDKFLRGTLSQHCAATHIYQGSVTSWHCNADTSSGWSGHYSSGIFCKLASWLMLRFPLQAVDEYRLPEMQVQQANIVNAWQQSLGLMFPTIKVRCSSPLRPVSLPFQDFQSHPPLASANNRL